MRIALVYDLRDDYRALGFSEEEIAEFDNIDTIDQLEGALRASLRGRARRPRQVLAARLAAGERFDLVFSIAEGLKGRSREAQVPALCELFDQPYLLSDPLTSAVALDKAVAKRLVRDAGVPTPPSWWRLGCERACRLERVSGLRQADRGRTGKGCESASVVNTSRSLPPQRRSCLRATTSRCWSRRICPAASSPSASSATARMRRARRLRDPAQRGCRGQHLLAAQQGAVRGAGDLSARRRR